MRACQTPFLLRLLPFFAVLATAHSACAGWVLTEEVQGAGSQMPGKTKMTIIVPGQQTRVDTGKETSGIVDSETGVSMSLRHAEKTARNPSQGALDDPKKAIVKQPKIDIKPTGKKDTINGFRCEEYAGTVDRMKVSLWVTRDVAKAKEIMDHLARISGDYPLLAALQDNGADFGFPIRTDVEIPAFGRSISTIISIKEQDVPTTTFQVPPAYKTMQMPSARDRGSSAPSKVGHN